MDYISVLSLEKFITKLSDEEAKSMLLETEKYCYFSVFGDIFGFCGPIKLQASVS